MTANVREHPPGSGIHGRPILEDRKIHLAHHRDGAWWTWCGQRVPDDHRCPTSRERDRWQAVATNCQDCYDGYSALTRA